MIDRRRSGRRSALSRQTMGHVLRVLVVLSNKITYGRVQSQQLLPSDLFQIVSMLMIATAEWRLEAGRLKTLVKTAIHQQTTNN